MSIENSNSTVHDHSMEAPRTGQAGF